MSSVSTPLSTVSTQFLIISDTHSSDFEDGQTSPPFRKPSHRVDVILHCGDLTQRGGLSAYKKALSMLGSIDAELKLVIAGNHDVSMDSEHYQSNLRFSDDPDEDHYAIKIWTGQLAAEAGVTHLTEGTYRFTLRNGATFTLYASPYTPEFCNWAFSYKHNEDRFNSPSQVAEGITSIAEHPIPDVPGIDIMMTHGPPKGILDECAAGHKGCDNLLRAVRRARPLLHCFGHIHEGYGTRLVAWDELEASDRGPGLSLECDNSAAQTVNPYPAAKECLIRFGKETLMVNAAIMNGQYHPENAPWLLDLDLPCV